MSTRSRSRGCGARGAAAAALGCLLATAAPAEDLFTGTWLMSTAESRYAEGEVPESMSIEVESGGPYEHYRSRTVRRNKQVSTAEYTAAYDGGLAMVLGEAGLLAPVSLKRIDERTLEATYQRAFQIVARSVRVLSADGRTMTVTTTLGDGKAAVNISVFHKHPEVLAHSQSGAFE